LQTPLVVGTFPVSLVQGHSAESKSQVEPRGRVLRVPLMVEQNQREDLWRRNSESGDDRVIFNQPAQEFERELG